MFSKMSICFLVIVVFIGILISCYKHGYNAGLTKAERACTNQTIEQLTELLNGSERLTQQANAASQRLAEQVVARQIADSESTREIKNALKKTASQRVNCVFDVDSLQQLNAAYQRATAATTGGISRAMPAAGDDRK